MHIKQRQISVGMMVALLHVAFLFTYGAELLSYLTDNQASQGSGLEHIVSWFALPAFTLAVGIGRVAQRRFFDAALIDGETIQPGSAADIDNRYVRNTCEQSLLAALAFVALTPHLPPEQSNLIPALCLNFFLMRIVFWAGYHKSPPLRALGFAGTFYPSIAALFYAGILAFTN